MSAPCPFQTLGLLVEWPIDEPALHRARMVAAAKHHPDRARDGSERVACEARMALVNRAASTLLDPVSAAAAVLAALAPTNNEAALPTDELMELLERHEWLEAQRSGDASARADAEVWLRAAHADAQHQFAQAIRAGQQNGDWNPAAIGLARLRALQRLTREDAPRAN